MAAYCYKYPHPAVKADVVIFTIRGERLSVLLVRRRRPPYQDRWSLPGGFIGIEEGLEEAAMRQLEEEAGVTGVYLEQLYTFGRPERDPRERVISVAHYALVPEDRLQIRAETRAGSVACFPVDALPELGFDHRDIIAMAQRRLAAKLAYSTIAFQFMPEQFTLGALQKVYEIILGEKQDKRNFRKRILALGAIEDTGQSLLNGRRRPARLYRAKHPGRVEIIR